ncbi:1328_t:CDS:10 [Funneliformis mosseae]|uniref:ATP-dependent RNA helicase DED1 n=1 Tax=Funneliformis mosseae TaxID=27381 RepID=A0A9N9HP58_FUNMO|nr:1328_t:CDS:10 [Funneliformis mosseae]
MNNNQRKSGSRRSNHDQNRQWAALRRRYDWNDSYDGTVAPRDLELENDLFGEENHIHTGINFDKYANIKVTVKPGCITPISSFDVASLDPLMKDIIRLARYSIPTPVQRYSIPIITEGRDLMACAQTGSGKTAAFLIPILSKLFGKAKILAAPRPRPDARRFKVEPLVLILGPTRELVTQIFDECRRFTYRSMLRPCVVYGGAEIIPQKNELAKGCDILSATPGRIIDLFERGFISLRRVKYLVLDEADRMLDLGFEPKIRNIVQKSDLCDEGTRQTLMYSATFPKPVRKLAKDFLSKDYAFLTVGRVGGTTSDITQKVIYVKEQNKRDCLVELLLKQPPSRTLIFVETKRGADSLDNFLYNRDFPTTSIHGDRSQREREDALISFKSGRSPILIATAVAARGLDIKDVMHVVNYDLCNQIDEYVHRIGRTARVGNQGLATSFYNERNAIIAYDLVKILIEYNQKVPDFLKHYKD